LTLLLTAFLAVWRARFPSTRKTALTAAAIGLSLNVLSVLFLLPPLLAAWDWRASRGQPRAERRRHAAILLIVPYLFLLPWTFANWQATHRLVFLESGRSDTNVITGALGQVLTQGPSYARALVGLPHEKSALAWAAVEVARNPLRFAGAVARRLRYAASLQPLLLAAAFAALVMFRRRRGHSLLGVIILYYLTVHCLMAVEERYFTPLWPLAAALAASLAGCGQEEPARRPWAAWLAACAFLPLAGLAAYAQSLVLAYPARSADPSSWERELAREPDAWLLGAAGKKLLHAGRPAEAVSVLTRSLRIVAQREQERMLAWALIIRNGSGVRLAKRLDRVPEAELEPDQRVRQLVMFALADLRAGRTKAAVENLSRAAQLQSIQSAPWGTRAHAAARDTLRSRAREMLAYWPMQDRIAILAALLNLPGQTEAPLWTAREEAQESLRQAGVVLARGPAAARVEALRTLDYAERLEGSDPGIAHRVAEEYLRLEAPGLAVETLRRLAKRMPHDLGLRFDLALTAHAAGRHEAALEALGEARALCSATACRRRIADAYGEIGEPRRAAALMTELTKGTKDAGDLAGLARLRMSMGEYAESLKILNELIAREPENARWRNDRGVVLILLGRKEEAIADRRLSLDKDPGMLSAALSLGTLLSSTGRTNEARGVYDRALARSGAGDSPTRQKIVVERGALR
jgi:tetratricopeptide (TPR) repeat protein